MLPFPKNPPVIIRSRQAPFTLNPGAYGPLGFWYSAQQSPAMRGVTAAIDSLLDLSGNNRHLPTVQATNAVVPAWCGKYAITCGRTAFTGSSTPVTGSNPRTFAFVAHIQTSGLVQYFGSIGSVANQGLYGLSVLTSNVFRSVGWSADFNSSAIVTTSRPVVVVGTYKDATHSLWLDGGFVGQGVTVALNTPSSGGIHIGMRPGGEFLYGHMYEAIFFTDALLATAITALSAELKAFYQL